MRRSLRLGIAAALFLPLAALAQGKACSPADATKAAQAVDRVVNWDQLYKTYQDYRHCDRGNVDDAFTEALMRCIVEWKHVEELSKTMAKDSDYRDFVHRHLTSPAAKEDTDSIYSRAKMSCPKGQEAFCVEIMNTVKPPAAKPPPAAAPEASAPPAAAAAAPPPK